jgi:hypothetical protein
LIVPACFSILAQRISVEIKATLIQAIILGMVVPPILEDLDKAVERERERLKREVDQHDKKTAAGLSLLGAHGSPAEP